MCIAIYKPADKRITKEVLKNCFDNNDDGAGFAYINTDFHGVKRLKVKKYMKFDLFYKQYKRAQSIAPESPFIIHFRIGTHGEKSTFNCHPFYVNKDIAFIHNGIISGVGYDKRKSDTQLFNELVLQELPKGWEYNKAIGKLIEDFIGASKLVTINIKGDVVIFNSKKGEWVDGCWFSNSTYKPRPVYPVTVYHQQGYSGRSQSTRRLNRGSYVSCDGCNKPMQLYTMKCYQDGDAIPIAMCPDCAKEYKDKGYVDASWIISSEKYILEMDGIPQSYRDRYPLADDYVGYHM